MPSFRRIILHPLCLFTAAGVCASIWLYRHAYAPLPVETAQSIPFDHNTHTDPHKVNMQCLSCHVGADSAAGAGIPHAETCLQCHRHIMSTDARLLPLHAAANPDSTIYTAEPLAWQRRAPLPSYVHFHHGRHAAAGISCAECHPNPNTPTPHTMTECLQCHRQHSLPTDCDACHH